MLPIALLYARVSTDEQADKGVSLDAQIAEARHYAAGRGWPIGREFQDVMSGKRDDRPAYQELLAEAKRLRAEGRAVVIVVAALDRFGRRLMERVRAWEALKEIGVPVHSVRDGGEVGEFTANILAAVAQEEVRRLGERVQASRRHFQRGGWYPSCPCPWGYRWRAATPEEHAQGAPASVLDVNPETAPYVQEAYRRVAQGESVRRVAAWVHSLPDAAREGRVLSYQPVRRLLSASVYVARPWDGAHDVLSRPVGRWPPLVDDALYAAVQARIADHARVPHQASGRFLLSGMIRCPRCGGRMTGWNRKDRSPVYICDALIRTGARCRLHANAPAVDAGVLDAATALVARAAQGDVGTALARAWQALESPPETDTRRAQLERTIAKAKQVLTRAGTLYAGGDMDKPGYELTRDQAMADINAAQAELDRLGAPEPRAKLPPWETVLSSLGGWRAALTGADTAEQRDVLSALIHYAVPVRVGRGKYRADIHWTALGAALGRQTAAA